LRQKNKIRTFIAVDIPESVRDQIEEFQEKLKRFRAEVKWVRPENIHITLKFLGDIEQSMVDIIDQRLKDAVAGFAPFNVRVYGTGVFPSARRPRVLWLGIDEGREILQRLAKCIDEEIYNLGFEREKREFSPHLTLGRVRSIKYIDSLTEELLSSKFESESFIQDEILLMRSDLRPSGSIYTKLKSIQLRG